MRTYRQAYASPFGEIRILATDAALTRVHFGDEDWPEWEAAEPIQVPVLKLASEELDSYFRGDLRQFRVPVEPEGTAFQRKVWTALCTIPFGETWSYGRLSRAVSGGSLAARAVGAANGRNPIGLIVPCHRVIGENGDLVGYAGGLEIKRWLLEHEEKFAPRAQGKLL